MQNEENFGEFIKNRRLKEGIGLREMGRLVDLSYIYIRDIELSKESAPKNNVLAKMVQILKLNREEAVHLYELAAKTKQDLTVPGDLVEYIATKPSLRNILRTAKELNATDEELGNFINTLIKNRSKNERDERQ